MKQMFNKQHKYSIRKLSIGICSAVIGFSFLSAGTAYANTDEGTGNPQTGQTQPPGEQGGNQDQTGAQGGEANQNGNQAAEGAIPWTVGEEDIPKTQKVVTEEVARVARVDVSSINDGWANIGNAKENVLTDSANTFWASAWRETPVENEFLELTLSAEAEVSSIKYRSQYHGNGKIKKGYIQYQAEGSEDWVTADILNVTGATGVTVDEQKNFNVPDDVNHASLMTINLREPIFAKKLRLKGVETYRSNVLDNKMLSAAAFYPVNPKVVKSSNPDLFVENAAEVFPTETPAQSVDTPKSAEAAVGIKRAIASSTKDGFPIENALDGNPATAWVAIGDTSRPTFTVELNEVARVSSVTYRAMTNGKTALGNTLYHNEAGVINSGYFEYSLTGQDGDWHRVHHTAVTPTHNANQVAENGRSFTKRGFVDPSTIAFTPVVARYIRLVPTSSLVSNSNSIPANERNGLVSLSEFSVDAKKLLIEERKTEEVLPSEYDFYPLFDSERYDDELDLLRSAVPGSRLTVTTFTTDGNGQKTQEAVGAPVVTVITPAQRAVLRSGVKVRPVEKAEFVPGEKQVTVTVSGRSPEGYLVSLQGVDGVSALIQENSTTVTLTVPSETVLAETHAVLVHRAGQEEAVSTPVQLTPIAGRDKYEPVLAAGSLVLTTDSQVTTEEAERIATQIKAKVTPENRADGSASGTVSLPTTFNAASLVSRQGSQSVEVLVTYADNTSDTVSVPVEVQESTYTSLRNTSDKVTLNVGDQLTDQAVKDKVAAKLQYSNNLTGIVSALSPQSITAEEIADGSLVATVAFQNIKIPATVDIKSNNDGWGRPENVLNDTANQIWGSRWATEGEVNTAANREYLTLNFNKPAEIDKVRYQPQYATGRTGVITKGLIEYLREDGQWATLNLSRVTAQGASPISIHPTDKTFSVANYDDPNYKKVVTFEVEPVRTTAIRISGIETSNSPGNRIVALATFYALGTQTDTINVPVEVVDNRPDNEKYEPRAIATPTYNLRAALPEASTLIANKEELPTTATYAFKADSAVTTDTVTAGDSTRTAIVVVTYSPTSSEEVSVTYKVVDNRTDAEKYEPRAIATPTYNLGGDVPAAADLIANKEELPTTATYAFKTDSAVTTDTVTAGDSTRTAIVVVTYSPTSSEEVSVTYKVVDNRTDAEKYEPRAIATPTYNLGGDVPAAADLIANKEELPTTATYAFKADSAVTTDTVTAGDSTRTAIVVVTYSPTSSEEVSVTYKVVDNRTDAEKYEPRAIATPTYNLGGDVPAAADLIANKEELPTTATYAFKTDSAVTTDTVTAGDSTRTAIVVVTYSPTSSEEVSVTYKVVDNRTDAEKYEPRAIATPTYNLGGDVPAAADLIANKEELPTTATYAFKADSAVTTDTVTAGDSTRTAIVVVTYSPTSSEEVSVTYKVVDNRTDAEKYEPRAIATPTYNLGGDVPAAADLIANKEELPTTATYAFKTDSAVTTDTVTAGDSTRTAIVVVTYSPTSSEEVSVTYKVVDNRTDAEKYEPRAIATPTYNLGGDVPAAADLIANKEELPTTATYAFKADSAVTTDTVTAGDSTRTAIVVVTYSPTSSEEVSVTYKVVDNRTDAEKYEPRAIATPTYNLGGDVPAAADLIANKEELPTTATYAFKADSAVTTDTVTAGDSTRTAIVVVTYSPTSSEEVSVTYKVTSLAQKYQPTVANDLTVKKNAQLTAEAILAKVTPQDGSNGTKAIQGDLPSTATVGTVTATVRVTYADQSVDDVSVQVTVEELDSAKYTATGGTLIRTLNQALTEDDVKAAVTVPAKAGQVTKELVGSLPSTDARGEKKATVKVTYGDQSSEKVEVTVQVVDESNREDLLDLIRRQQEELNRIRHEKEEATEERDKAIDEKVQAEIDKRLALAAVEIAKQEADSKVKIAEQEAAHAKGQADAAKKESDQAKADAEKAREDARQAKLLADNALLAHQSGLLLLTDAQRAKESALEELDQAKNDLKEAAKDVTLAKEEANKAKDALAQANRDNAGQVAAAQQAQQAAEAKLQQAQDFLVEKTKAKDEADRKAVEAAKEAEKLKGQVANLEAAKTTAEGAAKLAEAAKTKAEKALEEAETAQKQAEDKLKQALADKEQAERNRDNAIAQANREKEDAVARANREKETALADAKREKEDAVAQANREKEAAVAQANRERDTALADAKREKETALADAKREKEDAVAQANRERDTALADAKREKEDAVAQANREKEAAVAQANRERDTALADAKREKDDAVAQANREKEAAVAQANRERDTTLADAKREKEAAQAELARVQKAQADAEKRLKEAETAKTQAEQAKAQAEREKNDADTAKRLAADKAAAAEREREQAEKDLQAAQKAQAEAEKRLVAAELERAQALEAERAKAAKALEDANNKWLAAEQALATAKVAKAQVDGQLAAAEVARARAEQDRIQALDAASRAQEAAKLAQEQAEAKARAAEEALLVAKANLAIAEATKTAAENRLLILEQERTEAQRHYEAALASAQSDKTEAERKLLAAQAAIDGIRLELTAAELAKEDAQARFVQAQTDQATAQHEKNNALAAQAEAERSKADLEAKLRDLERVKAEELAVANHEKEVALAALAAAEREAAQALAEKEAALLALAEKEDVTPTPAPEAKPETSSVPTVEPTPNSVPTTSTNEAPGTASPEATAPVTPDSRPVETTGSAEPVAAETPETLAASARRELIDPRTDVRVQLESGETAPITGLTVRHRETNDVATPAVLVGQDYDLFDIVPVDQNGQPVAITKPALVLLPLDAGKAVEKVFYLPEGGSPDERVFTMTTITKADGQLVPAVAFIAEHFSDYGIVYKSTVQAATPVASSAATEQPVTDQSVANKPEVTEPATTKVDQPVVVARLTPKVPAAAPASATQTASSTSLPETSDSQSGVVSLGVVGLMSALGLMGLKRRHND